MPRCLFIIWPWLQDAAKSFQNTIPSYSAVSFISIFYNINVTVDWDPEPACTWHEQVFIKKDRFWAPKSFFLRTFTWLHLEIIAVSFWEVKICLHKLADLCKKRIPRLVSEQHRMVFNPVLLRACAQLSTDSTLVFVECEDLTEHKTHSGGFFSQRESRLILFHVYTVYIFMNSEKSSGVIRVPSSLFRNEKFFTRPYFIPDQCQRELNNLSPWSKIFWMEYFLTNDEALLQSDK